MKILILSLTLLTSVPFISANVFSEADSERFEQPLTDWDRLSEGEFLCIIAWELQKFVEEKGHDEFKKFDRKYPGILELRLRMLELKSSIEFKNCKDGFSKVALINEIVKQIKKGLFSPCKEGEAELLKAEIKEAEKYFLNK